MRGTSGCYGKETRQTWDKRGVRASYGTAGRSGTDHSADRCLEAGNTSVRIAQSVVPMTEYAFSFTEDVPSRFFELKKKLTVRFQSNATALFFFFRKATCFGLIDHHQAIITKICKN